LYLHLRSKNTGARGSCPLAPFPADLLMWKLLHRILCHPPCGIEANETITLRPDWLYENNTPVNTIIYGVADGKKVDDYLKKYFTNGRATPDMHDFDQIRGVQVNRRGTYRWFTTGD
jgi:hypothetical protein